MDRIKYLQEFKEFKYSGELYEVYSGFIYCLSPKETCEVLDISFAQEYLKRRVILRKIGYDISTNYECFHQELIDKIINCIDNLPYQKTNSCLSALYYLYEYVPDESKKKVLTLFLNSKYRNFRKRAYKILGQDWSNDYKNNIIDVWNLYKDEECAHLITKCFPCDFLIEHLDDILNALDEKLYYKLFLKIVQEESSYLAKLKEIDEITYLYVLTKINGQLSSKEAVEIYNNNYDDFARRGLILWCLGQLGMWDALEEIYDNLHD